VSCFDSNYLCSGFPELEFLQVTCVVFSSFCSRPLRVKIQSCVSRGGVPDEDCPTDLASMRFWCSTTKKQMQSDKTAVTASAKASVSAAVAFQALDGGFQAAAGLVPVTDVSAMMSQQAALTAPATPAGGSTL